MGSAQESTGSVGSVFGRILKNRQSCALHSYRLEHGPAPSMLPITVHVIFLCLFLVVGKCSKHVSCLLILYSCPFKKSAMDSLTKKLGLSDPPTVVWVPKVTHAEYPQLFANANAFVLPTHAEGWGLFVCLFVCLFGLVWY